ncbi:MAG: hypothetical protein NZT61_03225 [Deltaproteobacteria bacterium]|nr:hypothetical protein [Deltaproteobacteria bacterium]
MPADYPRVDLFLSFDYTGTTMKGMRSNFYWVVYRFIALAVFGLVASVEAQVVCRKNKDGVLVWSSRPSCPTGHSPVQKFIRANMMADNSVGTSQIADGAVTDSKILGVSWNKVQVNDNEIPWSKLNTGGARLPASAIIGQINSDQIQNNAVTDEKIQNVSWNKVQVNDNQIPWSKINKMGATLPATAITGFIQGQQIADRAVGKSKLLINPFNLPYLVMLGNTVGPLIHGEFFSPHGPSSGSDAPQTYASLLVQPCSKLTWIITATAPGYNEFRKFTLVDQNGIPIDPDGSGGLPEISVSFFDNEYSKVAEFTVTSQIAFINYVAIKYSESFYARPGRATWQIICE